MLRYEERYSKSKQLNQRSNDITNQTSS